MNGHFWYELHMANDDVNIEWSISYYKTVEMNVNLNKIE